MQVPWQGKAGGHTVSYEWRRVTEGVDAAERAALQPQTVGGCSTAHRGVSVADREIRSLGRLALQPPNGHVADGIAPGNVGKRLAVGHALAGLGLLSGC